MYNFACFDFSSLSLCVTLFRNAPWLYYGLPGVVRPLTAESNQGRSDNPLNPAIQLLDWDI